MIVDYLTFTFAKENEKKLSGLVEGIDAGAVPLETKNGYTEDWCLWGKGRLKWRHQGEMLARLSLPGSALALFRESGGNVSSLVITIGDAMPTYNCIHANAHGLARYAALCQENGIVIFMLNAESRLFTKTNRDSDLHLSPCYYK